MCRFLQLLHLWGLMNPFPPMMKMSLSIYIPPLNESFGVFERFGGKTIQNCIHTVSNQLTNHNKIVYTNKKHSKKLRSVYYGYVQHPQITGAKHISLKTIT